MLCKQKYCCFLDQESMEKDTLYCQCCLWVLFNQWGEVALAVFCIQRKSLVGLSLNIQITRAFMWALNLFDLHNIVRNIFLECSYCHQRISGDAISVLCSCCTRLHHFHYGQHQQSWGEFSLCFCNKGLAHVFWSSTLSPEVTISTEKICLKQFFYSIIVEALAPLQYQYYPNVFQLLN